MTLTRFSVGFFWKSYIYIISLSYLFGTWFFYPVLGNKIFYILVSFFCVFFLFFYLVKMELSVNKNNFFVFFVFFVLSLASFMFSAHDVGRFYTVFLFLIFLIAYASVRLSRISDCDFVFYTNVYFVLFVLVSVAGYFLDSFKLKENGLFGGFMGLPGVEGSSAHIDVFALLVLLLNLFYCRNKMQRNFIVFISMVVVFWAGTTAPLFSLMMVFCAYLATVFGLRNSVILFVFFVFLVFFILYASFGTFYYDLFLGLTNGRSYIWGVQMLNFFNGFDMCNVLFGNVASTEVDIHWGGGSTNNPHNAYLFILFRFGLVAFLLSAIILVYKSEWLSQKRFFILVALISAGMSGVTIVYISNPYYFLLLSFIFMNNDRSLIDKQVAHEI